MSSSPVAMPFLLEAPSETRAVALSRPVERDPSLSAATYVRSRWFALEPELPGSITSPE
jgi:hypothetical protein